MNIRKVATTVLWAGLTCAQLLQPTAAQAAAATPDTPTQRTAATASFTEQDYRTMARQLRGSDVPRTVAWEGNIEVLTYNFEDQVFLQIPYRNGVPYLVRENRATPTKPGEVTPQVTFGWVWWSAWVEFSSSEQAALAAGATGTIAALLSKNPITVGMVTTVIAVATAEGICPGGRRLRIYLPSFLMSECR